MKVLILLTLSLTTTIAFGQQDDEKPSPGGTLPGEQYGGEVSTNPFGLSSGRTGTGYGSSGGADKYVMDGSFGPIPPVDPNDPYKGMKPVRREAETLEKILSNTQTLVLVVDEMTWYHHRIPTSFDKTAFQLLARAILKSIEGNDKKERLLRNGHMAELHIAYTSKMYEQSGKYIPNVLETLKKSADARQAERTQERTRQLLGSSVETSDENMHGTQFVPVDELAVPVIIGGGDNLSTMAHLRAEYLRAEQQTLELAQQVGTGLEIDFRSVPEANLIKLWATDPNLKELKTAVRKVFELRIKLQTAELDQAEARIQAARKRLARRQQNAEKLIEERIRELTSRPYDAIGVDDDGLSE